MIRACCECRIKIGEREPLSDKGITWGYCEECGAVHQVILNMVDKGFDIGEITEIMRPVLEKRKAKMKEAGLNID